MALIRGSVKAWDIDPFLASERLVVRIVPTSTAHTQLTVFPQKELRVRPELDGSFRADVVSTEGLTPRVYLQLFFDWYREKNPESGEPAGIEWSRAVGRIRVPEEGGWIGDLLDAPPPPDSIVFGVGAPSPDLGDVIYIDTSGVEWELYGPAPFGGF